MNKKKKIANKKHRKNKARMHALHIASLKKAKKKPAVKPVNKDTSEIIETVKDSKTVTKKTPSKKAPAKKSPSKKAPAKKATAKKTPTKKK